MEAQFVRDRSTIVDRILQSPDSERLAQDNDTRASSSSLDPIPPPSISPSLLFLILLLTLLLYPPLSHHNQHHQPGTDDAHCVGRGG